MNRKERSSLGLTKERPGYKLLMNLAVGMIAINYFLCCSIFVVSLGGFNYPEGFVGSVIVTSCVVSLMLVITVVCYVLLNVIIDDYKQRKICGASIEYAVQRAKEREKA